MIIYSVTLRIFLIYFQYINHHLLNVVHHIHCVISNNNDNIIKQSTSHGPNKFVYFQIRLFNSKLNFCNEINENNCHIALY